MRYVLEHVPDPSAVILRVKELLSKDGFFIFSVPNPDSLDAKIFGKYWLGHDVPRHFHNFSANTLHHFLEKNGMRISRINYSSVPNDWIGSVQYWLNAHGYFKVGRFCDISNPLVLLLFFPFGLFSFLTKNSGRIQYIIQKV
jgi:hypothetical protein